MAKSLVIFPDSIAPVVAFSKLIQKFFNSSFLSNLALCKRPLVQAKIEATELVEVDLPFKCS